ncbi:hypothetical protein ANCCEY_02704 [Ancylostoma ceylanicum]|uniref:MRG domain-containing protein n=1 Tax=Ancylostoma ceylanicum TaxID=53326 RepID=A0A0D6M721_9BILA|nr:hypothetical protein ANCCEY_02704 [Ancylostoma ceylanicum]
MPQKPQVSYQLNDRILCNYNGIHYEGKIVNVSVEDGERVFTVHYQGWHKRHDVDIKESMTGKLFLPYTVENVARAKAELESARIEKKRKMSSKASVDTVSNDSTSSTSPLVTPRRGGRPPKISVSTLAEEARNIEFHYANLPKSLRDILTKDQDAVLQRRLLAKLPAVYPIDTLLHEFLSTLDMELEWDGDKLTVSHGDDISSNRVTAIIRSCQMITDYFNMILGKLLLYQPERDQYQSELLRLRLTNLNGDEGPSRQPYLGSTLLPDDSVPVRLTSVYGLPHLLRLFDCLTAKFENLPPDSGNILVLSNIPIPTSNDVVNGPTAAFQMDDKSIYAVRSFGEFLNTCPASLPVPVITGSWHVTHASRKWVQSVLADLDEFPCFIKIDLHSNVENFLTQVIELLASGQSLPIRKSLISIFRRDLQISCMKMEFLDDNPSSRFEISYLRNGKRASLIGEVMRGLDKSLEFSFGPTLSTKMIVAHSTDHLSPMPFDVLVLSQTDFFPKCENYIVLQRARDESRILQILTSMGANFPSNPLLEIHCEQVPEGNNAIIRPLVNT